MTQRNLHTRLARIEATRSRSEDAQQPLHGDALRQALLDFAADLTDDRETAALIHECVADMRNWDLRLALIQRFERLLETTQQ